MHDTATITLNYLAELQVTSMLYSKPVYLQTNLIEVKAILMPSLYRKLMETAKNC